MDPEFDKRFFAILQRKLLESRHVLWPQQLHQQQQQPAEAAALTDAVHRARASRLIGVCDRARAFAAALRHSAPQVAAGEFEDESSSSDDDNDADAEKKKAAAEEASIHFAEDRSSDRAQRSKKSHTEELLRFARSKMMSLSSSSSGPGLHPLGAQLEHSCVSATNFIPHPAADPSVIRVLHISGFTTESKSTPEPVIGARTHLRCANVSVFDVPQLDWKRGADIAKELRQLSSSMFRFAVDRPTEDDDDEREDGDDGDGGSSKQPALVSELTDALCSVCYS